MRIPFVLIAALALFAPAYAGAQVQAGVGAEARVTASTTLSAAVITRAKAKADAEIDRRIKALNALSARVAQMGKVTAEFKQSLGKNVQTQISGLAELKARIDADEGGATLREDIRTITQSYRIYALVMPQARIAAAADREAAIVSMLADIGSKLQARIEAAKAAGADVTAVTAALADMGTKLASAQTHAQAAVNGSAALAPDGGDSEKMKTNGEALKAARNEIESARQDLAAARQSVDAILKSLRTLQAGAAASSSAGIR